MSQTELEFKLEVPPGRRAAVEAAVRTATARRTHLQARYFDTADGALAAQGVVLRLRKEGRRWVQTAKARGEGPLQRHEHNVDLGMAARGAAPTPDLRRHQDTPVGELLARALAGAARDGAPAVLLERHATDVWRTTREVRVAGAVVELAFDHGRVTAGERSATICELELELLRGDPGALAPLAARWASRYGLWLSTVSKAERGERLARGAERSPAVKATAPRYGAEPSGRQVLVAVVGACLAQILPNASEAAAGSDEAEHIHQLRVGVRRLRTALRDLGALDGPLPVAWEPALEEAFRALGMLRDHEVLQQLIEPRLRAAGGPAIEWPAPDARPVAPAEVVRSPALQAVLIDLLRYTIATPVVADDAHAARRHLRRTLDKLHRALARDAEAFVQLPAADQHRVRKRLKRLRYLAEFAAPLFHGARADRLLRRIEAAQDALGQYNDESVALATARAATADDPRAWFAVGWLGARSESLAQACVGPLTRLGQARPFWPPVRKKKKTKASTPD